MFKCDFCNQEFESKSSYAGHRSGHARNGDIPRFDPDKKRSCEICGFVFDKRKKIEGHMNLFHSPWESLGCDRARKKRLLTERGRKCQVCNLTSWLDREIPIELDHIDGNPENSTKENLRLICPNCHAQTETYRGKNMGKVLNSKRKETLKKYYAKYR